MLIYPFLQRKKQRRAQSIVAPPACDLALHHKLVREQHTTPNTHHFWSSKHYHEKTHNLGQTQGKCIVWKDQQGRSVSCEGNCTLYHLWLCKVLYNSPHPEIHPSHPNPLLAPSCYIRLWRVISWRKNVLSSQCGACVCSQGVFVEMNALVMVEPGAATINVD